MTKLLNQISLIERIDQLIRLRATGSPKEIAHKLDCPYKSVDNGLRRIKRKIEKHLKSKF